jgi:Cys-tRNA(Pro) deacylase
MIRRVRASLATECSLDVLNDDVREMNRICVNIAIEGRAKRLLLEMSTAAIHMLRQQGVAFTEHPYRYEERGGTRVSARELGVDEHAVVKTLVMEDDEKQPLIVLMHGTREVSTKQLARQIGRKTVAPCDPQTASKHTGYLVGGTSPFGTKKPLPVFLERSILDLERIYVNGGRRGFLVSLRPDDLVRVLAPTLVDVATDA